MSATGMRVPPGRMQGSRQGVDELGRFLSSDSASAANVVPSGSASSVSTQGGLDLRALSASLSVAAGLFPPLGAVPGASAFNLARWPKEMKVALRGICPPPGIETSTERNRKVSSCRGAKSLMTNGRSSAAWAFLRDSIPSTTSRTALPVGKIAVPRQYTARESLPANTVPGGVFFTSTRLAREIQTTWGWAWLGGFDPNSGKQVRTIKVRAFSNEGWRKRLRPLRRVLENPSYHQLPDWSGANATATTAQRVCGTEG